MRVEIGDFFQGSSLYLDIDLDLDIKVFEITSLHIYDTKGVERLNFETISNGLRREIMTKLKETLRSAKISGP